MILCYLLNIWTTGGFDCRWNIQEWTWRATTHAGHFSHAGHFLLHPNNLMLSSIKLCDYYLLAVGFSTGNSDDGHSLQTLHRAEGGREGYYPRRTRWPIYGVHLNVLLLIFKYWNSSAFLWLWAALLVQLECIDCGYSWSASRDAVSMLTLDASDSKRNVGTAPWATAKFENVEKKLVSPRETDKSANDIFMPPVLEAHKSFGKSRKDENMEASKRGD